MRRLRTHDYCTTKTEIDCRSVYFYSLECLRLVLKGKGNARHFVNWVWLTDGRGAGGQGHTSQKKIYKMLPINIEKQRKGFPFIKLCVGYQTKHTQI